MGHIVFKTDNFFRTEGEKIFVGENIRLSLR